MQSTTKHIAVATSLCALALPLFAFAADAGPSLTATYKLMAPLTGYLTGEVNLSTYLQGAVQVIIGIAGILAVLMIVICGIKLMGTPSASAKSEAKECIWNAIFGLLLAIGAWAILNTINGNFSSTNAWVDAVRVSAPSEPRTSGPAGPLTILPPTDPRSDFSPTASVGTNYSSTIGVNNSSTGGTSGGSTYQWTITENPEPLPPGATPGLPPGVSLYNRFVCTPLPCRSVAGIAGTPTTPGTYIFTVLVRFGTVTTTQTFTIVVAEAPVVDTSSGSSGTGTVGGWTIGTGQALYIKGGDAMLTGEWNYDRALPPVDSYLFFEWGTTASLGKKTPRVKIPTTGDVTWGGDWLSGLTPGTTYFYRAAVSPSLTSTTIARGKIWSFVAGTPGSWPRVVTTTTTAPPVCPTPAAGSLDRTANISILLRDGGGSSVDQLRMDSGTIAYYKVVAAPKPEQSVLVHFTQGQQPSTPGGMVSEYSVSRCPGVIDTTLPTPCYMRTGFNSNTVPIYTAPVPQYGWNDQASIGEKGCFAPVGQSTYYVNVRWTYPTCPYGAGNCGTSMQWAPTGSNF